jgi:HSP20 family protein
MPIVRWDPFSDIVKFNDEIGRWFEESDKPLERSSAVWTPKVDIKETNNRIEIKADVPGMKMEDIDISVDDNQLIIKGEREEEKKEEKKDYVRVERSYGSFYRSFYLGTPVKEDKIKASYKNGVLDVILPKAEIKKPKKIAISDK